MRTTFNISDDVLNTVKRIARDENSSVGRVVTELLLAALSSRAAPEEHEAPSVYGFRPFPHRGVVVTNALIDELREVGPY